MHFGGAAMTPHKYDHILIYTNPTKYKFKNKI